MERSEIAGTTDCICFPDQKGYYTHLSYQYMCLCESNCEDIVTRPEQTSRQLPKEKQTFLNYGLWLQSALCALCN